MSSGSLDRCPSPGAGTVLDGYGLREPAGWGASDESCPGLPVPRAISFPPCATHEGARPHREAGRVLPFEDSQSITETEEEVALYVQ